MVSEGSGFIGGTMSKKNRKNKHNLAYADNTLNFENIRNKPPQIIPRSLAQEHYVDILTDINCSIAITSGPAGTGKTYLAMLASIRALRLGQVEKIVLTRPAVGVDDERHGFLPGDLNAKMEPWTSPLFDVLKEYYSPKEITRMLEEEIIEISPLAFMRGRTFKKSWIIADEMQNSTPEQMKMVLTRIGDNSRMTITGDLDQHDRGYEENGLADFVWKVGQPQDKVVTKVKFEHRDIERHPAVSRVLNIYGDDFVDEQPDKIIKIS